MKIGEAQILAIIVFSSSSNANFGEKEQNIRNVLIKFNIEKRNAFENM